MHYPAVIKILVISPGFLLSVLFLHLEQLFLSKNTYNIISIIIPLLGAHIKKNLHNCAVFTGPTACLLIMKVTPQSMRFHRIPKDIQQKVRSGSAGYATLPTIWACSGLSPVRARPWHANKKDHFTSDYFRPLRSIFSQKQVIYNLCGQANAVPLSNYTSAIYLFLRIR